MQARLKSSKKWTSLPREYLKQIEEVFRQTFKAQLAKGKILAEGKIYPQELILRVGYLEAGRLAQANFEVSVEYDRKKESVVKMIYLAIDCAASMMAEYVNAEDDQDFPREWKSFKVEGKEVFLQYSTVNTELEAEADKLLGVAPNESLIQGEDTEEDKEAVKRSLGIDEDED